MKSPKRNVVEEEKLKRGLKDARERRRPALRRTFSRGGVVPKYLP